VSDKTLSDDWTEEQPELAVETIQFTQENAWPLFLAAKKLDRQVVDCLRRVHTPRAPLSAGEACGGTEGMYPESNTLPKQPYPDRSAAGLVDFNGEEHLLSFSHKPTRVNYWHFELWVKDGTGVRIPRDKSNAHTRYLAKSLLEYIIAEAVISKVDTIPFKRSDFD
jgi:hypothetical protein